MIDLLEINYIKYYSFDYKYIKSFIYLLKKYDNKKYIFKLPYQKCIKEYKFIINYIIEDLGHKNFYISPSNFKKTLSELDKMYEDLFISVNYINNSKIKLFSLFFFIALKNCVMMYCVLFICINS